jgi:5'-3' exoribonuclease 1
VLVIAVDGVAPRAKMNQQRSRRFRTAKETAEAVTKAQKAGTAVPDKLFDSNCITPGTEFMEKLNDHFAYFIKKKVKSFFFQKFSHVIFQVQKILH